MLCVSVQQPCVFLSIIQIKLLTNFILNALIFTSKFLQRNTTNPSTQIYLTIFKFIYTFSFKSIYSKKHTALPRVCPHACFSIIMCTSTCYTISSHLSLSFSFFSPFLISPPPILTFHPSSYTPYSLL